MTKTEFCRRNQISTEKNQIFSNSKSSTYEKIGKKLEKNLVSSENGCIFAKSNETRSITIKKLKNGNTTKIQKITNIDPYIVG